MRRVGSAKRPRRSRKRWGSAMAFRVFAHGSTARRLASAACLALAAWAVPTAAVDEPAPGTLTGTLARIARSGVVRLGYREDVAPFAFVSRAGVPSGYSIDLCRAMVESIRAATGARPLAVALVRVRADERMQRIEAGEIDLECGSTTITAARAARIAFSPPIFIAGTRLAVPAGGRLRSIDDLAGRRVAAVRGSTNETVVREVAARRRLAIGVELADDLAQAFDLLDARRVEAVAGDDILLLGQLVRSGRRKEIAIVGELLSFDRYGIAFARDDALLRDVVVDALRALAASGELRQTYDKWFVNGLPNGMRLGQPMGDELKRSFEMLGQPRE